MGKALGIVSLIFGIIGMIISFFIMVAMMVVSSRIVGGFLFLAFVLYFPNIVAIICGRIGIKKDDSPGLAIAGLILGSIGFIITLIATFIGLTRW